MTSFPVAVASVVVAEVMPWVVWQVHRRPMLRPGPRANDDGAAGIG